MPKTQPMPTDAQLRALDALICCYEVWWHDLPPGTRRVLLLRGWMEEKRAEPCGTRGHRHPGYMTISKLGLEVWKEHFLA